MSYAAKDLVARAKEMKQQEKLERERQRSATNTLANELRVSNEKEKLQEVDFFNSVASQCITAALSGNLSCQLLDDVVTVYADLISGCGFRLVALGLQNVSQLREELPSLDERPEWEDIVKNSPWSSIASYKPKNDGDLSFANQTRMRVIAIDWASGTSTACVPRYPGFNPVVLKSIASVENKSFNIIFESVREHIQQGKKKMSFFFEEYEDGQCTADVISGLYLDDVPTSLNEFQVAGVFTCLGYETLIKNLKITAKDPGNLIRKIELKVVW
ncbi:hypothetical protein KZZ10_11135 [Alcaligenaceae bacterium LF4-65]|uniref:Uncharacterized protein n=1 Tax=Zwartia hollandica TaxID=324606 RepID=A0A953T539_9BURK|nr:hypothetical protein [Zwartia hollandica]MBZ1351201.1 hypothetical protein [Zwartia hollandica]